MPVDFQIKNAKVQAVGALVMLMHASEMARKATTGRRWSAAKRSRRWAPQDYCGVVHWNGSGNEWLWGGRRGWSGSAPASKMMLARIDRMIPGRHAAVRPGACRWRSPRLQRADQQAAVKHMIIISDGDPDATRAAVITQASSSCRRQGHDRGGRHPRAGRAARALQNIATATGGKYYVVKQSQGPAADLPARGPPRRPAADLREQRGCSPQITCQHEMISGIEQTVSRRSRASC